MTRVWIAKLGRSRDDFFDPCSNVDEETAAANAEVFEILIDSALDPYHGHIDFQNGDIYVAEDCVDAFESDFSDESELSDLSNQCAELAFQMVDATGGSLDDELLEVITYDAAKTYAAYGCRLTSIGYDAKESIIMAATLSALSQDRRKEIMDLVKTGTISNSEAFESIVNAVSHSEVPAAKQRYRV